MLIQESIHEYQKILSAQCGVDLTDNEAQESAEALFKLYEAVFKEDYDETKEGHKASTVEQGLS